VRVHRRAQILDEQVSVDTRRDPLSLWRMGRCTRCTSTPRRKSSVAKVRGRSWDLIGRWIALGHSFRPRGF